MNRSPKALEKAEQEAARWLAIVASNEATSEQLAGFRSWLHESTVNKRAYDDVIRTWHALASVIYTDSAAELRESIEPGRWELFTARARTSLRSIGKTPNRMRAAGLVAATAVLASITVVLFVKGTADLPSGFASGRISSTTAEIQEVDLIDGSTLVLGAKSTVDVDMTREHRHVNLLEGQAFFSVARDVDRPFEVVADETIVRVLGTKFDIHRSARKVKVAVLEGTVNVALKKSNFGNAGRMRAEDVVLRQGQQAIAAHSAAPIVVHESSTEPGAWLKGRFSYKNAELSEVINDAARYYYGDIELASEDIQTIRVTTSFSVSQIDDMIDSLALAYPLRIDRPADDRIVIRATH